MGSNNKFGRLQTPATTPQGKSLYPNLSQYAANRAQTLQIEPNGALVVNNLEASQSAITRLLNRCRGQNSYRGSNPPSPPESFNLPQHKDLAFALCPLNYIISCVKTEEWCMFGACLHVCVAASSSERMADSEVVKGSKLMRTLFRIRAREARDRQN